MNKAQNGLNGRRRKPDGCSVLGLGFNCAEKALTGVPALFRAQLLWFAQMPAHGCIPWGGSLSPPCFVARAPLPPVPQLRPCGLGFFRAACFSQTCVISCSCTQTKIKKRVISRGLSLSCAVPGQPGAVHPAPPGHLLTLPAPAGRAAVGNVPRGGTERGQGWQCCRSHRAW